MTIRPAVIESPHLDDAALSFGLVLRSAGQVEDPPGEDDAARRAAGRIAVLLT